MATASVHAIPVDVVLDIMARLPVKSLIRLRLISKSFFSMTAASNFITSHLALSRSSGYAAVPFRRWYVPPRRIAILDESFSEVLRLEFSFSSSDPEYCDRFVSSCHGLLCFTDNRKGNYGNIMVLWNPMIRKFKSITDTSLNSNMLHDSTTRIALGLGFDGKNNDYKIIRIVVSKYKNEPSPQVEIYSLKTDSWRKVIFPFNPVAKFLSFDRGVCLFVDGALHWFACLSGGLNSPTVILSYKMDDEQLKVIRLPQDYASGEIFTMQLIALKGSLALAIHYVPLQDGEFEECKVWKMNKHEEVESWTEQIITVPQISRFERFTDDGKAMLRQNVLEVSLYNLETGTLQETKMGKREYVFPFRESLVLL